MPRTPKTASARPSHAGPPTAPGVAAFERALALAEALGDPVEHSAVLAKMSPALGRAGRKADDRRVMELAVELLQHAPDRTELASAYDKLSYELMLDHD